MSDVKSAALNPVILPGIGDQRGSFPLPELPYPENALEPHISDRTLALHHGKHNQSYVQTLNRLLPGTEFADLDLETLIRRLSGEVGHQAVFNAAAQAWNHSFYWNSLRPPGGNRPSGTLLHRIESSFGSMEALERSLSEAAVGHFGSGWAWIVADGERLRCETTHDADNPLTQGLYPLATIDVWEHAYYLDFQNRRPDYVRTVIQSLLNWDFVAGNLARFEAGSGT